MPYDMMPIFEIKLFLNDSELFSLIVNNNIERNRMFIILFWTFTENTWNIRSEIVIKILIIYNIDEDDIFLIVFGNTLNRYAPNAPQNIFWNIKTYFINIRIPLLE